MPNEITVVFHNLSNYDYHYIIEELANKFEEKFKCPGENKRKCKSGGESVITISYKTKFFDSARFMATPLSNLADNLTEEIPKIKCKKF